MKQNIELTREAIRVIEGLRHSAGTHELYRNTLTRLFNHILHAAEDLGMDELEALETLRTLDMIRLDLATLAKATDMTEDTDDEPDEDGMHELTEEELSVPSDQSIGSEPRLMLEDVNRASHALYRATEILAEAALHAGNAGEKYNSICDNLTDILEHLNAKGGILNEIMSIDPETYKPAPNSDRDNVIRYVREALEAGVNMTDRLTIALKYAESANLGNLITDVIQSNIDNAKAYASIIDKTLGYLLDLSSDSRERDLPTISE